jgi:hypothetical protein
LSNQNDGQDHTGGRRVDQCDSRVTTSRRRSGEGDAFDLDLDPVAPTALPRAVTAAVDGRARARPRAVDALSAHTAGNVQLDDRAQLVYTTREGRAIVTANVADFIALAHEAVATNTEHAGIVLIPSSFRGDEVQAIAAAVPEALEQYRDGLRGLVVYIRRE